MAVAAALSLLGAITALAVTARGRVAGGLEPAPETIAANAGLPQRPQTATDL
ncbi:MAG TPA: hypothetical protein VE733_10080 [Streptosporangiaceae bacterium]|jgi:hypothetical protein|nr:hypothetical protein [Streptosporangiaceae bacterium]